MEFWRSTRQRFDLLQTRQQTAIPDVHSAEQRQRRAASRPHRGEEPHQATSSQVPRCLSDVCVAAETSGTDSSDKHKTTTARRHSALPSNCRPQFVARSLLRDEFEPDKAAACIHNPVSINEANQTAKRLQPWPRGVSWNSKRLTWSIRFWKDDGKTLITTSIPARKHGGVEEAFRKSVALRKRSFMHVLARVASECQEEGRALDNLKWHRATHEWKAQCQGASRTWSADTEDEVKATWKAAVEWLIQLGDMQAASIDIEYRLLPGATPLTSEPRISTRRSEAAASQFDERQEEDDEYQEDEEQEVWPRQRRRATTTSECLVEDYDDDEEQPEGLSYHNCCADDRQKQQKQGIQSAVAAYLPFPPGLIWARTTTRFFAVFKDPTSASTNKRKRFKTFDPKRYGGVDEAYSAAMEFLSTVEPWESTKKNTEKRCCSIMLKKKKLKKSTDRQSSILDEEATAPVMTYSSQESEPFGVSNESSVVDQEMVGCMSSARDFFGWNARAASADVVAVEPTSSNLIEGASIDFVGEDHEPVSQTADIEMSDDWDGTTAEENKETNEAMVIIECDAICNPESSDDAVPLECAQQEEVKFEDHDVPNVDQGQSRVCSEASDKPEELHDGRTPQDNKNSPESHEDNSKTAEEDCCNEGVTRSSRRRNNSLLDLIDERVSRFDCTDGDDESEASFNEKGTKRRKKRRRKLKSASRDSINDDQQTGSSATICKKLKLDTSARASDISNYSCLAEHLRQMEEENLYGSDDSLTDMNEQAKRLKKFSNISWVPQKKVQCNSKRLFVCG